MRLVLWGQYARLFRAGQRVLDVGCGTGIDAIYLAQRGIAVTGVDVSAGMIARLEEKVERLGLAGRVQARVMDAGGLAAWPDGGFDGLISAFASLSALPDLAGFADDAARLLRPGGRAVLHLLNRFSLWEWLSLLARGRWSAASRLGRRRERDFVIGGRPVRHRLYYPEEAYRRFFAGQFRLCGMCGLGSLRPPHTLRRIPAPLVAGLGTLERRLDSRRPFVNWGRLFVLDLEKRG
jgi:SAM-dependent methyltransferase